MIDCKWKKCALSSFRVDHLYTFFVQWSPEIYTKSNKKHRRPHYLIREKHQKHYLVVEKNKVAVINKLLSSPSNTSAQNWEVSFTQAQIQYIQLVHTVHTCSKGEGRTKDT